MALPVSLAEAKAQLKILDDAMDGEIEDFIRDAADWVEGYTGQILEARDVVERFNGFGPVSLRAWPIAADAVVTVAAGDLPPPAAALDISTRPARVRPAVGSFWPFVETRQPFSVTVRAGYEDPNDVPRGMCRAMLILIKAYDEDREGGDILAQAEETAKRLCRRQKRHTL